MQNARVIGQFVVTHGRNNPFYASPLEAVVRRLAPARIVMAGVSTTFVVGAPGTTINFRFDADPYLKSYLSANALSGSQAEGSLSLNFNIIDSNGKQVFNWVPDGVAGGLIGGTENADAFSLNTLSEFVEHPPLDMLGEDDPRHGRRLGLALPHQHGPALRQL